MSEYLELCPGGDKDDFVSSTLKLILDVRVQQAIRQEEPLPEPSKIEKELGRVRKALAGLSNHARTELLIREAKISGEAIDYFVLNKPESALSRLKCTAQEKYERPWRQDGSVRMGLVIFAANIFLSHIPSHKRAPRHLAEYDFVLYVERLIEDCSLGGDGGVDAERLIRDYQNYLKNN